jgi:hypothetical protein
MYNFLVSISLFFLGEISLVGSTVVLIIVIKTGY